jgi:arylsulfatase A-like enzyme
MNRRSFLSHTVFCSGTLYFPWPRTVRTEHVILIVNGGGTRKKEYYEDASLSPNIRRLAREGFVFEEDHCETVSSHDAAFAELLQGRTFDRGAPAYPTALDYIGDGAWTPTLESIPRMMQRRRPRILVCRETVHDVGHDDYEGYLRAVRATDLAIGKVFDWIRSDPYFHDNTAIVVRPEFGRDDELNAHGELHHSYGFYCTHRVASIFWGPDFNRGIDRKTIIKSIDMAPTLARLFGVDATHAQGRVVPGLFNTFASRRTEPAADRRTYS